MAEALQLGVDVIATAYGGNTDFCSGPLAYPCADGCVWGEPDLEHAAELMQQRPIPDPSRDPEVWARYRARLEELRVQRPPGVGWWRMELACAGA
jgi:hypothetical protein